MSPSKPDLIRAVCRRFNSIEWVTLAYALLTGVYILCFAGRLSDPLLLLFNRVGVVLGMSFLALWDGRYGGLMVKFARVIFPFALLGYWYPETYSLNHGVLLPVLDSFFDRADVCLFGCRPSLEFSRVIPAAWFSELMYFAYFSFFLIYVYIGCRFFFHYPRLFYPAVFVILTSFFLFYLLFILIPVEGPQFYWPAPDNEVPEGYFFSRLMRFTQSLGERPTAAFPSSHVGMTLIYMWILFRVERRSFWPVLPVACLLVCSTVYIKAHYLVDVVAAFVVAPVICWTASRLYGWLVRRFPGMDSVERIRLDDGRKKNG